MCSSPNSKLSKSKPKFSFGLEKHDFNPVELDFEPKILDVRSLQNMYIVQSTMKLGVVERVLRLRRNTHCHACASFDSLLSRAG